jgi:hypothetical protein
MGISGLSIMFDLLLYVLVFGAAALVAKWMIGLHWTRAHTEYVTELLDCGRLSISERCSRVKTVAVGCSWRRYTVCDDKFVMAASDESSTVIHVDVSLIANDEEELFFAREMHEILSIMR